jgi:hypothetical protein
MRPISIEERAIKIKSMESIRDCAIATIEGLRSGNNKYFVKDEREEALNDMFAQVEFEMEREAAYQASLKKLEEELRADEAKP